MFENLFILAEAGVNHNGSIDLAFKLCDAAKQAGADGIKFQTFVTEALIAPHTPKAPYQTSDRDDREDQFQMLKALELSFDDFRRLKTYCDKIGLMFLSTAFDPKSFAFLQELSLPFWKVPSGEITNVPYLREVARTQKPVVLSTGMSLFDEIDEAVATLELAGARDLTLLHCTSAYPTPYEDVNLRAMTSLRERYRYPVGYSDHTPDDLAAVAAVALGATFLEKHFTLDQALPGPDHKASLDPPQLKTYVDQARAIQRLLGSPDKTLSQDEAANRLVARKQVVAKGPIQAGETFRSDNLQTLRPGTGLSPRYWDDLLGRQAKRSYDPLEPIDPTELEGADL